VNKLPPASERTGIVAWFARNPVAANLLMLLIIFVGIFSAVNLDRKIQPDFAMNRIQVSMAYPGAGPDEVERGIVLKIEEALKDIDAIKRVDATARESMGVVVAEVYDDYPILATLDEIKSAIDSITSFPEDAERPVVKEMKMEHWAINLQLVGDLDERERTQLARDIRDEIIRDPRIAIAKVFGTRDYEVSIEIPEESLRKYQLSLGQVAMAVRNSSIDLPGGSIRSDSGDVVVRTKGQAYVQRDFEEIVLITYPDGTRLTLGDIAVIDDGFVEVTGWGLFDGSPSSSIGVYAAENQDLIEVAEAVKEYVELKQPQLPEHVEMKYWADSSYYLQGRVDLMLKNLAMGAMLVFIILGLFLNLKLAFWVMAGLPVCFLGAFALMSLSFIDQTLNMISLFGFILVLGIVVDDAIIIGESAFRSMEQHGHGTEPVIHGALQVAAPATFGVLTTIVAFAPTLFTAGIFAPFPAALGWVVILCLMFSLVESKWILPAHLSHIRESRATSWSRINQVQLSCNRVLQAFIKDRYLPFLKRCIKNRYTTLAVFAAALIITVGLVTGGIVRMVIVPNIPGDFVNAKLELVEGSADWQAVEAHDQIVAALEEVNERYREESGDEQGFVQHVLSRSYNHRFVEFMVELVKSEDRKVTSVEFVDQWREAVGEIPGAQVFSLSDADPNQGAAVSFNLIASDSETLERAAAELASHLRTYDGLNDIRNGASVLQDEIVLNIKPAAEALGITQSELGQQVRQAFYGAEAQRIQRGDSEIKVMVRYPREDRQTIANLENMYIRTQQNDEVPFAAVADMAVEPAPNIIRRIDGQRAVTVSAGANKAVVQPAEVAKTIETEFMPALKTRYPGLDYSLSGESEEDNKLMKSLFLGFVVALIGIYALLAIPLKSYIQPVIIMGVIPFGIIGAVFGHIVMGMALNMLSLFGIIALAGVVVNDSLILIDSINRAVAQGVDKIEALLNAAQTRFRAILLTSLTTFFGLFPMLLETSFQAQMVVPMAVSLAFGIVFATFITLLLVPCLYTVLQDFATWRESGSEGQSRGAEPA